MSQLSTPEKKKIEATLLTSASQARNWVQDLPLTNMGEVTRVLYQSLVALNQHPMAPNTRIDITEVLLPYINIALENLERHFSTRAFPLPERSQKVFDLKQTLQLELAGSYQLAALDMLTRGSTNQKKLLIAVGRSIKFMGRSVVYNYRAYIKGTRNIWQDLHHLYLLACENRIADKVVPKGLDGKGENLSIDGYYKLFNLVALSVPNGMRQDEVERLEKFFLSLINTVTILDDVESIKGDYAHIALLNSDEPAVLMPIDEVLNSPTSRIFNISRIEVVLKEFIVATEGSSFGLSEDQPMLNSSLAKRLLKRLTTVSKRRNKRFERDDVAGVVMRLNDVHAVVRSNDVSSDETVETASEEDNLYEQMSYDDGASSPWSEIEIEDSLDEIDVEIQPWFITNSSAKGYGLRQKVTGSTASRVGELMAIRDPSDETENWQVVVIRWMDFYRDKGLCLGTEILSPRAISMMVTEVSNRDIPQRLPVNGLVLPQIEGVNKHSKLILPGHMFHWEDIVTLELKSRTERVQITDIDECMGSFAFCDFIPLEEEKEAEPETDFNDVWDFI